MQVGNIYTLTSDVTGSLTVKGNNMVLDGNGHTIIYGGSGPGNVFALSLNDVSNVTLKDFTITGGWFGISFWGTSCLIANNTITGTGNGIQALDEPTVGIGITGDSNIISGNYLANNYAGIVFYQGENNLIVGNTIKDTAGLNGIADYGLTFWGGALNNTIYHNNFENNASPQAFDAISDSPSPVNVWDNGYPAGGNYWSNYQPRYRDAMEIGTSGIGNKPYEIDSQNIDQYPLLQPFNSTTYLLQTTPPKISLLTPTNQTYTNSSVPFVFSVDVLAPVKDVNWTGYSLDGAPNVTITSNNPVVNGATIDFTVANVTNGLHSIIVYANDSYGNMAATEPLTFTVKLPPSFPTAIVAGISVVVVAVIATVVFYYFKKCSTQK